MWHKDWSREIYVGKWPIFCGPVTLLNNLKTILCRKVILVIMDQCDTKIDIMKYFLSVTYILCPVILLKILKTIWWRNDILGIMDQCDTKIDFMKYMSVNYLYFVVQCLCLISWRLQATPAMSTSRISKLPLISKWFFILNIFSLYFFAFQLRLCRKRLTRSNGYLEVIFHALDVFSITFASIYVEVLNRRSHGCHIVCFGYGHVLAEVRTSSKQQ